MCAARHVPGRLAESDFHQPVNMKYCFIQFECDDTFGRFGGLAEAKHGASEQSRQGVAQIVQLSVA